MKAESGRNTTMIAQLFLLRRDYSYGSVKAPPSVAVTSSLSKQAFNARSDGSDPPRGKVNNLGTKFKYLDVASAATTRTRQTKERSFTDIFDRASPYRTHYDITESTSWGQCSAAIMELSP